MLGLLVVLLLHLEVLLDGPHEDGVHVLLEVLRGHRVVGVDPPQELQGAQVPDQEVAQLVVQQVRALLVLLHPALGQHLHARRHRGALPSPDHVVLDVPVDVRRPPHRIVGLPGEVLPAQLRDGQQRAEPHWQQRVQQACVGLLRDGLDWLIHPIIYYSTRHTLFRLNPPIRSLI